MPPPPLQRIPSDDETDKKEEQLPELAVEERHFPISLFGYRLAMDTNQNSNFQYLIGKFDQLEICISP
ncbi:hypothetical protein RB195_002925 [Necator americanus]|uniref:Uncharacterized protein n=1 Tax=Necator americanus TaxID=51031 RepID=A0ABR1DLQ2_NECAM